MRVAPLCLLAVLLLGAAPADPVAPDVRWARARREELPAFSARQQAAAEALAAADAYFAGDSSRAVAFPDLPAAGLDDPAALAARLGALDRRGEQRAAERVAPLPALGTDARAQAWRAARDAALDAEDAADAAARRLLLALRAQLTAHPALSATALEPWRRRLADAEAAARAAWEASSPPDPVAAALADAAARDRQRLDDLVDGLRTLATVPGAPAPDAAEDLAALPHPEAAARLRLLAPHTDDAAVAEALTAHDDARRAALQQRIAGLRVRLSGLQTAADAGVPPKETGAEAVARWTAEAAARTAERQALADGPFAALERERLDLQVAVAELQARRSAASADAAYAADEAAAAGEAADAALQEAERADAEEKALLEAVADALRRAQSAWEDQQAAANAGDEARRGFEERRSALADDVDAVLALGAFDPGRREAAGDAWRGLRGLHDDVQEAALQALEDGSVAADERRAIGDWADATRQALQQLPGPDALAEQRTEGIAATAKAAEAVAARADGQQAHLDALLRLRGRVEWLRQRLRPEVARADRQGRRFLSTDLQAELRLAGPAFASISRARAADLRNLPSLLSRFDRLRAVIVGSLWLLLGLLGWAVLRSRAPRLTRPLLRSLAERDDRLFPTDVAAMEEPARRLARASIDLLAAALLVSPARERVPELALLLLFVRQIALYFFLLAGFELLVSERSRPRPSLLKLRADGHAMALSSARLLLLWGLAGRLANFAAHDVLGAEALATVSRGAFTAVLTAMTLVVLHRSWPLASRGVQQSTLRGPIADWATTDAWPLRSLKAAVGLASVVALRLFQLVAQRVRVDSAVGRVLNRVSARQLGGQGAERQALGGEQRWRIQQAIQESALAPAFPDLRQEAAGAWAAWQEEGQQGLVAVVGEQGQGRSAWVRGLARELRGDEGPQLLEARLEGRLEDPDAARGWLASALGLTETDEPLDGADLARRLAMAPKSLIVLQDLQHGFLRRVGGFAALRAVFEAVAGSSDRHFWILALHGPAWRYLDRVGSVLEGQAFRCVLELPRATGAQLQERLVERTTSACSSLDFSPLAKEQGAADADGEERTREAFFRLLAEAAGGNPAVAAELWLECLGEGADGAVRIHLSDRLDPRRQPSLTDGELLTLAAIRVHEELSLAELARVNNVESNAARTTLQLLRSRGLVDKHRSRWRIATRELAAVQRVLRRRHFVYGG